MIVLSDQEYEEIHNEAKAKGISASKYVYDLISRQRKTNGDPFEDKWKLLQERLKSYPTGAEFDISILVGTDLWKTYDRGTKLALARTLKRKVDDGTMDNVSIVGRSSSNVTIYRKDQGLSE